MRSPCEDKNNDLCNNTVNLLHKASTSPVPSLNVNIHGKQKQLLLLNEKSRAKEETTQVFMNGRKGELSAVLKSLSVVAEEGGGLFGSLGLITTFCREYRS